MTDTTIFTYNENQQYLHNIDLRLRGLRTNNPERVHDIERLSTARADVVSRMTPQEIGQFNEHEQRTLTPEQRSAEAKIVTTQALQALNRQ